MLLAHREFPVWLALAIHVGAGCVEKECCPYIDIRTPCSEEVLFSWENPDGSTPTHLDLRPTAAGGRSLTSILLRSAEDSRQGSLARFFIDGLGEDDVSILYRDGREFMDIIEPGDALDVEVLFRPPISGTFRVELFLGESCVAALPPPLPVTGTTWALEEADSHE